MSKRPYESRKLNNENDIRKERAKNAYEIKIKNTELNWVAIGERLGIKCTVAKKNAFRHAKENNLQIDCLN